MKIASLSIVYDEKNNKYLMIKHQRGINKGYINFPGGKQEKDETMIDCVIRETFEETGITISNPKEVGYIEFIGMDFIVYVFKSTNFTGKILGKEDEVDVFWQDANNIPFDKMRASDREFIPQILAGKFVKKRCYFDENQQMIKSENIDE